MSACSITGDVTTTVFLRKMHGTDIYHYCRSPANYVPMITNGILTSDLRLAKKEVGLFNLTRSFNRLVSPAITKTKYPVYPANVDNTEDSQYLQS